MKSNDKKRLFVFLIFLFIFFIRLIYISNPPLDYSSWRQVDTDSIAQNFLSLRFNIFYPQLNYDGPPPNYVQLELQITTFIIALLYRAFGVSPILGRLVPVAFFMMSCYYLYRLVKRTSGRNVAAAAVLIYGILPVNVVYSRNIMPESALMFFSTGALYYFTLYNESGKSGFYILSMAYTILTILTKPPAALIGIPMIYMSVKKKGAGVFRDWKLILFPVVVFGAPYIYFALQGRAAEQRFVEGIGSSLILPNFLKSIFEYDSLKYLLQQFSYEIITIPGLILFAAGIFIRPSEEEYFYYAWLAGCIIHIAFIDAVIHLDYYLMFVTPVVAIFSARACRMLLEKRKVLPVYVLITLIGLNSSIFAENAFAVKDEYITLGDYVTQHTDSDDLIIIDRDSPELFYTSGRKGWRLYGSLITTQNIGKLVSEGADYFIPSKKVLGQDVKDFLDSNYQKITLPDGYYMYKLSG